MPLPPVGLSKEQVLATLRAYKAHDAPWLEGRVMAGVYDPGPAVAEVGKAAYAEFLSENALYPNLYPSLLKLETDTVRTIADWLGGGPQTVGNFTSGGTESILLAVKAARDWARAHKPQVQTPEMVLCITAHPAFHKAAHYLGLKVQITPMNPTTFRADVEAMRQAINENTVLLVGSAPCYSHGVVDPIPEIAALAQEKGVLCHVDACVGGIHLSVMRTLGFSVPAFDLSIPGVTSLSTDLHKYGYAAKNASVILYHSAALRRFALYANARTTGYAVINPTVLSSKSGGPLAGAWATLHFLGLQGYQQIVSEVQRATERLLAGIAAIPELQVLGKPDMCMFAFSSGHLNVFELEDALSSRGWFVQAQFSAGGGPANLHLSVNRSNVPHVEDFLTALQESVAEVKRGGGLDHLEPLRQEVAQLLQNPGPDPFNRIAALAGLVPGQMPTGFARINTLLELLPDELVESLLVEYVNSLYR
ncbi:MAG: aspartate aminotransferase family protein [Thermaceae bacterium]|nr:aspartate aminotransferase family protein [Thermaceae bacterium]